MKLSKRYSYAVVQPHLGDTGAYFDAGTLIETSDYLKAVLLSQCNSYNGEILGKVKSVRLLEDLYLEEE